MGRISALPPTSSFGGVARARPIVADFASQQIDATSLFDFSDPRHPRVLYQSGAELDVSSDPSNSALDHLLIANESGSTYFPNRPLNVIDVGGYRIVLQTTASAGGAPAPIYLGPSSFSATTLNAPVFRDPGGERTAAVQVLFRFYPDGTQIGALNEGEVALFQSCNYQGKAVVFAAGSANFAQIDSSVVTLDNTAASVRLGNNTAALLYSGPIYTGTRTVIKADTPCLPSPANTSSLLVRPLDRVVSLGTPDCTNCRLVGANLSGANLSGFVLTGADLTGANVACANFSGSSNEQRVDLTQTTLTNVAFGTNPSCRTRFNWTILNADSIPPAQWKYVDLSYADIEGLTGKVLSTQANPLDLTGAMLSGATLQGAVLDYATGLADAVLTQTVLTGASLRHVDLSGATLSGAILDRANLDASDLSGAILSPCAPPASCVGASLRGTYLRNVNLSGSHLESAIFENASFYSSELVGPSSCDTTSGNCASANGATMTGTQFTGAYLAGTDFGNAIMHGVVFGGAVLVGANFSGATVSPLPNQVNGDFSNAFLQGANLAGANLDGVTMLGAFLDFAPNGNTLLIELNNQHTRFAGWATPGSPVCTRVTYPAGWASVPTSNSTITCPDGTVSPPGGCGPASSSAPLNPHWNNGSNIATNDPSASYRFDATYTTHAADLCQRNIAW